MPLPLPLPLTLTLAPTLTRYAEALGAAESEEAAEEDVKEGIQALGPRSLDTTPRSLDTPSLP